MSGSVVNNGVQRAGEASAALNPNKIAVQEFPVTLRGYDRDAVRGYLVEVARSYHAVAAQALDARHWEQQYRNLSIELEHVNARATESVVEADLLARTLMSAQRAADRLVVEAREEAARIVHEARTFARQVEEDASKVIAPLVESELAVRETELEQRARQLEQARLAVETAVQRWQEHLETTRSWEERLSSQAKIVIDHLAMTMPRDGGADGADGGVEPEVADSAPVGSAASGSTPRADVWGDPS